MKFDYHNPNVWNKDQWMYCHTNIGCGKRIINIKDKQWYCKDCGGKIKL